MIEDVLANVFVRHIFRRIETNKIVFSSIFVHVKRFFVEQLLLYRKQGTLSEFLVQAFGSLLYYFITCLPKTTALPIFSIGLDMKYIPTIHPAHSSRGEGSAAIFQPKWKTESRITADHQKANGYANKGLISAVTHHPLSIRAICTESLRVSNSASICFLRISAAKTSFCVCALTFVSRYLKYFSSIDVPKKDKNLERR